jgi:FMN phosphatase YigB (HAD superfamily)
MHTEIDESTAARRTADQGRGSPLSLLATTIGERRHTLLCTDLFDTVLLRDRSTESQRLAAACRRAAPHLGVDPHVLTRLRWSFHDSAYRAVAMERPEGDAALSAICATIGAALGLDDDAARVLRETEVEVDITHLRPNRPLLALFERAVRAGDRIVAVSDTYYGEVDLRRILEAVVGPHPLAAVYSSADLGVTKHRGLIFDGVAKRENVSADEILHCGDHPDADVSRARTAGWTAVHLPRGARFRAARFAGRALSLPVQRRRAR